MLRALLRSDTADALRLLEERPLHNLFLAHVVRAGALGVVPGFVGFLEGDELCGVLLIAAGGTTALAVRDSSHCASLAEAAAASSVAPRHIMGPEDTTVPFWKVLEPRAAPLLWQRREPVYLLERSSLEKRPAGPDGQLETAREDDLDRLVQNSASQYEQDLGIDRYAEDPLLFRDRHAREIREGRWWVLRDRGHIVFQVHVGASGATAIQIGGVFTPPEHRRNGYATRALRELSERLLRQRESVTLFCDESNAAARRIYERLGYAVRYHQRSFLLESPETHGYA